jgi:hypothetical protein
VIGVTENFPEKLPRKKIFVITASAAMWVGFSIGFSVSMGLADMDDKWTSGDIVSAPADGECVIALLIGSVRHVVDSNALLLVR